MAGSFTNYTEAQILNLVFGLTAFTPATPLYVGLSTTTISDAGANITEPVAAGYARVSIANNKTTFSVAADIGAGVFQLANAIEIAFPVSSGSWGTVTYFFVSDALVAGNIYIYGDLTTPKLVTTGDIARFAIGELKVQLD